MKCNLKSEFAKLARENGLKLKNKNLNVKINVDVYGMEEGLVDITSDAIATLKSKKRKRLIYNMLNSMLSNKSGSILYNIC